jgi:hypothetical protein
MRCFFLTGSLSLPFEGDEYPLDLIISFNGDESDCILDRE